MFCFHYEGGIKHYTIDEAYLFGHSIQHLPAGPYLLIIDVGNDMSGDIQKLSFEKDPRSAGDKCTRRFHK